jgi:pimeloyl-ACP methyl ester carboxylesterase
MLLEYRQFEVISNRNQHLSCLLFINDLQRLPTILYLHGNGGSKMEVLPILRVENKRVNVCAFDFSGCGRSDGEYVTYGSNEASDVKSVVDYLRRTFQIH